MTARTLRPARDQAIGPTCHGAVSPVASAAIGTTSGKASTTATTAAMPAIIFTRLTLRSMASATTLTAAFAPFVVVTATLPRAHTEHAPAPLQGRSPQRRS